jgi:hypothetical protein
MRFGAVLALGDEGAASAIAGATAGADDVLVVLLLLLVRMLCL